MVRRSELGDGTVTTTERFAAVDLQCRWADAVDRRDWPAVLTCFTRDATAELPRTGGHRDREAMVRAIRDVVELLDATQHHLSNHLVDRTAEGLVARCYVLAQHVRTRDGVPTTYTFGGRYTDRLRYEDAQLRIAHRTLEVVWSVGPATILHA